MDKWEYKVIDFADPVIAKKENKLNIQNIEQELNLLGEEGWEVVTVLSYGSYPKVFLKRQKS